MLSDNIDARKLDRGLEAAALPASLKHRKETHNIIITYSFNKSLSDYSPDITHHDTHKNNKIESKLSIEMCT